MIEGTFLAITATATATATEARIYQLCCYPRKSLNRTHFIKYAKDLPLTTTTIAAAAALPALTILTIVYDRNRNFYV